LAFTGSVVAKREVGKPMVLSVIGQNHQLAPSGKGIQPFPIPRIELGVEDVSVRRLKTAQRHSLNSSAAPLIGANSIQVLLHQSFIWLV